MKPFIIAIMATIALVAPAGAGTQDEMVKHGILLSAQGMEIEVAYTPDGKFTAMDGQVTGAWRLDGDKVCTSSNLNPVETCTVYPSDKKSGDVFEIETTQGPVKIKIK